MRSTRTSTQHVFLKEEDAWKLQEEEQATSIDEAEEFIVYHKGQTYLMNVPEDQEEIKFVLEDEAEFAIGYDSITGIVFLDVDGEAFMNRDEQIFRLQRLETE